MKSMLIFLLALIPFYTVYSSDMPISDTASGDTLKLLTWNVYMLPYLIYPKTFKKQRANEIVKLQGIKSYDIIVFQETFHAGARKIISKGLKKIYPYQYGPLNHKLFSFRYNGGVYVLSKIPLQIIRQIVFKARAGYDKYAMKGAVLLEGMINHKKFQIIGTHIQASGPQELKNKQFQQIRTQLLDPYRKDAIPQIICGDLNINAHNENEYTDMMTILGSEDGKLTGDKRFTKANGREIDYILIRNNNSDARVIKRNVLVFEPGSLIIPYLSDHYAVEALIEF
jgi:endonuclease/exonuclease/phosphatase family metal-dependent hydrolase